MSVFAQQKTALQSNGTTTIFDGASQFTNAYNAAVDGDTIYLPGGLISSITLNKSLTIFGVGYHPDSTTATGKTIINGSITLQQDADSSHIEGLELTGGFATSNNHKVDYLTITRCYFNDLSFGGTGATPCSQVNIKECVIKGDILLNNVTYSNLTNNIIEGKVSNGTYNSILNNVFLSVDYYATLTNTDNSIMHNNVFFKNVGAYHVYHSCDYSNFSNNIFVYTPPAGTNTLTNNFYNIDISTVFVNQIGNVFDFSHDYHLINPATYQGLDNTNVGVFGGLYPFKEGTNPQTPHIQSQTISTHTNATGDLNIQIEVEAQDE